MPHGEHSFLFSSLDSKQPNTARKVHIRRLFDVLHLCIQRHDWPRARRAWAILARCKEVDWTTMWRTSLLLLGEGDATTDSNETDGDKVGFLTVMMRQFPEERESILKELVLHLIHSGQHRRALEELDLYLPSYPYQDNPVLHVYAGLMALYLAQPASASELSEETTYGQGWDASRLRNAQAHFERARLMDPSNVVAEAFLNQLSGTARAQAATSRYTPDSDEDEEEKMEVDGAQQARKRVRA
ncbi:RNA polymerase I-specific transcription initiation factor rrn11 [Trametes pubescens]|uniref:RNA polymerase I-specific transcription initiation factor rrn11 n=1 Tax=Trametes pubescens TaxID=154538 RepID=A0A1M2VY55_TRAPU|nr:RNA polymerase I-specific transcription initiation factor rrn11 [Trametes pubescens]